MITSSKEEQVPFVIVHLNVAEALFNNPVIVAVRAFADVMVAVPTVTLHVPVPVTGVFPASVADNAQTV